MILTSTRAKCFTVIAPHGQIITFNYDAPDLVIPDESMEDAQRNAKEKDPPSDPEQGNGLDSQWNARMKERLERMKSKKLRDTSITVSQKDSKMPSANQNTEIDSDGNLVTSGHGRVREELTQTEGRIEFMTSKIAGNLEVCVQSILASTKKPARIHIQADMAASDREYDDDDQVFDDDDDGTAKKKEKTNDPEHLEHKEISTKMSRLERDLHTLKSRVKACQNNADFNKEQEAAFHLQSISMNRAARYWPIIQLTVLLVTGFTQANHIVRYLKSHHIV